MVKRNSILVAIVIGLFICYSNSADAQRILDKRINISVRQQRLDDVLAIISNQAGFSFSYNSSIVRRDSLVTMNVQGQTVRQVLNQLFNGGYGNKEIGNQEIPWR